MQDADDIDLSHAGPLVPGDAPNGWLREAKETLRLAVPMATTQVAQMAILATDTFVLGHFSTEALAAAALGNTIFFFAWLLGIGPANAVPTMIAHILGEDARNEADVRAVVRMGLWAGLLLTPPLLLVLFFARPILLALGQETALAGNAALYVSVLAWGLPFALAFHTLRGFSAAVNRPVPPMIVMLLAILCNAIVNYLLVFGHFGLPRLGLVGAGLASVTSNIFSVVAMLAIIRAIPALHGFRVLSELARPHWAQLRELFRLGMPIGITTIFELALFNGAALMMGMIGTASIAAHQIAITVPSLTFMIPLGIGMAATVRVGLAKGAGDGVAARRAGFVAMALALAVMSVTALILLLFPGPIARAWMTDSAANREVLVLTIAFLQVAAIFQWADGLQVTASMSLRGLKDTRAPMLIAGGSYWLFGFPACWLLAFQFGLQGLGIWYGLALALFVAAALLTTRFLRLSHVQK